MKASVIWLLVFTAVGLGASLQTPAAKPRADDEAVIEAAMLAFYPKSASAAHQWR